MKNSTKLKAAAEDIKGILRKYDIAGAIQLHAPGHGEFFIHLNASYSCAYIYNDEGVRFYSKKKDHNSKAEQLKKQADTANMLKILTDITAMNFSNIAKISGEFGSIVNAEHGKGEFS